MDVKYWSRSSKRSDYEFQQLAELFASSDVIFPTLVFNEETKTLITSDLLKSMKTTAMFISVVHELFDERLILDMVKNGSLFGFGFEAGPKSFNNYEGNVWAAPAYAWATDGTMANSIEKQVENMVNASKGKYPNRINLT